MNKSVLISIQPYYVYLIIARLMGWDIAQNKTVEVRKDLPKDIEWNKTTHIYCSKNKKSFNRIPAQYQPFMEKLLGKVIGEFVCDDIDEFQEWQLQPDGKFQEAELKDLENFLKSSCLTLQEVWKYRVKLEYYKPLYVWHISALKIYDKPKELGAFHKQKTPTFEEYMFSTYPNGNYEAIRKSYEIKRPPQSWCYVELEY